MISHEKWRLIDAYPGAHIRVKVKNFYHHGIYIGDNRVIQFGLPEAMYSDASSIKVLNSTLKEFMGSSLFYEVYVFSKKEEKKKYSDDIIVKNALNYVGQGNYNILTNNCEHFANKCIFGENKSSQIDDIYKNVERLLKK